MVVILMLFSSESIHVSVEQDLASQLTQSVKENLEGMDVIIDESTGQITFNESTMFDIDSYELKSEAKKMLNEFIPKYINTIYSKYSENVDKIVIKGHTDDSGNYLYNLDLSQQRALSVAKYIVSSEIGEYKYKEDVLLDIEAIGRSEAELIKNEDGSINQDASRRVEIKYELDIE